MAKIRTKNRINWGGWNPFIKNFIEIEMLEIAKTENGVIFSIKDYVIAEKEYLGPNQETLIHEYILQTIRDVRFNVSMTLYNQLYEAVSQSMNQELTPFEKDSLRPKMAFLMFFQNDKIIDDNNNQFCLYGTQPNDWEIKE